MADPQALVNSDCHRGKTIMMDAGIHPGFSGEASLPFLDTVDLDTVDVLLVTHFHLDHCAAVPYVVGRTKFKVFPVYVLQHTESV